jgi:hypothetical protein
MNLLKKVDSKKEENKRKVLDVEVDGEVSELFRQNLIRKCEAVISNEKLTYDSFFLDLIKENTIFIITESEMKSVGTLLPVISNLKRDDEIKENEDSIKERGSKKKSKTNKGNESNSVTAFNKNALNNLLGYAIHMSSIYSENEIDIEDTCIYFRKYQKGSKISRYGNKTSEMLGIILRDLKTGKFSKVDGDIFKCDDIIDAIYYERQYLNDPDKTNIKIMFVENKNGFEEIFSFNDFYIKRANDVYKTLCSYPNIKLESEFYSKFKEGKKNLKKICALDKEGAFNNIDFDTIFNVIDTASDNDYYISLKVDGKNIIIENEDAFDAFAYLCLNQVMEVLPEGDIYYVDKSKPLPKKGKQQEIKG